LLGGGKHLSNADLVGVNVRAMWLDTSPVIRSKTGLEISTLVRVFLGYLACDWSVVAWSVFADVVRVSAKVVSPGFVFHFS
jgi:hypothetical protein